LTEQLQIHDIHARIGAERLRVLVERFYFYMDTLPKAKAIRDMHPKALHQSIEKLYMFLSGLTGGPNLYWEKYGHPRLRARHLPFPIGADERDAWLLCMRKALDELQLEKQTDVVLWEYFQSTADFMRNKDADDPFKVI
jgi:hemoglobin